MVFTNGIYCFYEFNMNYSTRISPSKTARIKTNISSKVAFVPLKAHGLFPQTYFQMIRSCVYILTAGMAVAAKMSQVITAQTSVCKRSVSLTSMKSIKQHVNLAVSGLWCTT